MNSILKNWKTSAAGLGAIFAGLGVVLHAVSTNPIDMNTVVAGFGAISTGIGLLFAKDGHPVVDAAPATPAGVSK
jgi:hypothetical protein